MEGADEIVRVTGAVNKEMNVTRLQHTQSRHITAVTQQN